jgi:hypothetical protein
MLMSMRLRLQRKRIGGAGREAAAGIGERIVGCAAVVRLDDATSDLSTRQLQPKELAGLKFELKSGLTQQ